MERTLDPLDESLTRALEAAAVSPAETLDDRLAESAAQGDTDAFRRLVERYQVRIYHFCFQWLQNAEDAREATQDAFVRAYDALHRYRETGKFEKWLFTIALNQCRDRRKSKASRQGRWNRPLGDLAPSLASSGATPDECAVLGGDLEKLLFGIQLLPEKLRAPLILCALEGISQETCAEILHCSVRAVEGRLYRARRELAAWWEREPEAAARKNSMGSALESRS